MNTSKHSQIVVMLKLPDLKDVHTDHYLLVENLRQAQFDVMESFLATSYMKYDVTPIITGGSYQSRSGLRCDSVIELNPNEMLKSVRQLGFTVTHTQDDWRNEITIKKADNEL